MRSVVAFSNSGRRQTVQLYLVSLAVSGASPGKASTDKSLVTAMTTTPSVANMPTGLGVSNPLDPTVHRTMTEERNVSLAWAVFSADLVLVVRKRARNLKVRNLSSVLRHSPITFSASPRLRPSILPALLIRCMLKINNTIKRFPSQINLAVTRSLKLASKV